MPRPGPDIAGDINRLVPQVKPNRQTLDEREARAPIGVRRGQGASQFTSPDASSVEGTLTSSDGAFVIVYDYHQHGIDE